MWLLDALDVDLQLEELDKQLEELKQQATPKFRLALHILHQVFRLFVVHVTLLLT